MFRFLEAVWDTFRRRRPVKLDAQFSKAGAEIKWNRDARKPRKESQISIRFKDDLPDGEEDNPDLIANPHDYK